MTTLKHTPGSWHTGVRTAYHGRDIYGQHGELIAIADEMVPFTEVKPNARLIAAAPDLLAAARRIFEVYNIHGAAADQLRAAIKKATE